MLSCMCYYDDVNSISYIKMDYPKIIAYLKDYLAENLNTLNSCCLKKIITRETFLFNKKCETFYDLFEVPHHCEIRLSDVKSWH